MPVPRAVEESPVRRERVRENLPLHAITAARHLTVIVTLVIVRAHPLHRAFWGVAIVTAFALVASLSVVGPVGQTNASATTDAAALQAQWMVRAGQSNTIFIVATSKCRANPCVKLLRTDNEGRSFTTLSLPPVAPYQRNPTGTLDRLVFADNEDGYILEGRAWNTMLFATHDGGRSWNRVPVPRGSDITSLAATSSEVYLVTMHCQKQSNGNWGCLDYQLLHSRSRSAIWSSTVIPVGRFPLDASVGSLGVFGTRVWTTMMSSPKSSTLAVSSLLRSYDSGRTLTQVPAPILGSINGCDLTALSIEGLWAACPTGMEVSFFFSEDAGTSWNRVPVSQFMGTGGGYFDPVSTTAAYLDYGEGLKGENIFRVTDAGRRMTAVGTLTCDDVSSFVFASSNDGLALCSNDVTAILERTTDAARRWHDVALK